MSRPFSFRGFVFFAMCVLLLLAMIGVSQAQTTRKKISWERMQRDLDIMEGILNKLLMPSASDWDLLTNNPRGLYFDGYGVVFQIDTSGPHRVFLDARKIALEKQLIELKARIKGKGAALSQISRLRKLESDWSGFSENLEELKEQLIEFFGTYADAIGQLKRTDQITILTKLGSAGPSYNLIGSHGMADHNPVFMLEATVKKADIIDYRRGRMDYDDFRNSVLFEERMEHDAQTQNLEIMASIMNTALSRKYHKQFGTDGNVHGIHLDGLGVIFFMQGNLHGEFAMAWPEIIDISRKKNNAVVYVPAKERRRNSLQKYRKLIQEYKDALLEVVGDYGHTLRTIKSTEYVVVALNFRHASWGEEVPKRMIMKIKKRDLDRYNRGDISFTQFKRKVVFNEYQ